MAQNACFLRRNMHRKTLASLSIMRIEISGKSCYNDIKIRGAENPNNNRRKGNIMKKVKEILYSKYRAALKAMNETAWKNAKQYAAAKKQHLAEYMYMGLEITVTDIKRNGGYNGELWREISEMHRAGMLASNSNRGNSRGETKYWLTRKGFAEVNKNNEIC